MSFNCKNTAVKENILSKKYKFEKKYQIYTCILESGYTDAGDTSSKKKCKLIHSVKLDVFAQNLTKYI